MVGADCFQEPGRTSRSASTARRMLPVQRRFFASRPKDPHRFTLTAVLRIDPPLDWPTLRRAVVTLVERYDSFHGEYTPVDRDGPGWEYGDLSRPDPDAACKRALICRRIPDPAESDRLVEQAVAERSRVRIDQWPLLRLTAFDRGALPSTVVFTVHHLSCDASSAWIVLHELAAGYRRERASGLLAPDDGRAATGLQDWACGLTDYAHRPAAGRELALRRDPFPLVLMFLMPLVLIHFFTPTYRAGRVDGHPVTSGAGQSVPGMTATFAFFALAVVGLSVFREHDWRTWDRLRATPMRPLELYVGKALVPVLLVAGQVIGLPWWATPFTGCGCGAFYGLRMRGLLRVADAGIRRRAPAGRTGVRGGADLSRPDGGRPLPNPAAGQCGQQSVRGPVRRARRRADPGDPVPGGGARRRAVHAQPLGDLGAASRVRRWVSNGSRPVSPRRSSASGRSCAGRSDGGGCTGTSTRP
jgi:hypothetical protein